MTIKKIGLSLAAVSVFTASAIAGTLTATSTADTIASELLVGQDYNVTSVDINTSYRPSLNAGIQDGKILITFENAKLQNNAFLTDLYVYNKDQNKTVGINPTLSGADKQKLIFDINDSINDNDELYITDAVDGNGDQNLTAAHDDNNFTIGKITVKKDGTDKVSMTYQLLDNVDAPLDTSNPYDIIKSETEWTVSVTQKFDALIDAANGFLSFSDKSADTLSSSVGSSKTNSDGAIITFTRNDNIDIGTGNLIANVQIFMDTNISASGTLKGAGADLTLATNGTGYSTDHNDTITDANTSDTYVIDYNLHPSNDVGIDINTFTTTVKVLGTAGNHNYVHTYLTTADLGKWDIYGYNAQIPGASYSDGSTDTIITVVNTQKADATPIDAIITIIDENAKECKLNSSDGIASVSAVKPGSRNKYRLSEMLAESACSELTGTAFAIELNVPTTPTDIYSNAFVQNIATANGRFKVLPVYNNANKY